MELSNLTVVEAEHESEIIAAIARGYDARCSPCKDRRIRFKALRFEACLKSPGIVDCDFVFATVTECIATEPEAQLAHAVSKPEGVI